jgi:transposase-like protein
MKTLIPFYIILLLTLNVSSQETIAIPDIGLEECLIDLDIDSNGLNGSILVSDAKYVVNLNINDPITNKLLPNVHSKIKDLTGLESFPNLKRLDCFDNEITKIDLSKSTSITFLNCSENKIESLNLSNNTELVYVSCDNNKLNSLIIGNNPNLENLYVSYNKLTSIDVKGCTKLESFDSTGNKITGILVNDTQLNNTPEGWYKDESSVYTNDISVIKSVSIPTKTVKNKNIPKVIAQTKVEKVEPVKKSQPTETAANYYEKFQLSVVTEYDKLVLDPAHLQSKKDELQKKYDLNPEQLTEWINKYVSLMIADRKETKPVGSPKKLTPAYYSTLKKAAVDEYERAVLNPSYLQTKKEEVRKKHNLSPEQFTKWIDLLGNSALRVKTIPQQETTESYYVKFKKSVVNEYENLVLNAKHLHNKKSEVQQKYNVTAIQLTEWINKHSKVKTH